MEKKKMNIEFVGWHGMYESIFSSALDDEIDNQVMEYERLGIELDPNEIIYDIKAYAKECAKAYVHEIENWYLPDGIIEAIDYDSISITMPREYNFTSNRIFADVVLCDGWLETMVDFLEWKKEEISTKLRDEYTSHDGFCSHIENAFDKFVDELKKGDSLYFVVVMRYMIESKYGNYALYNANKECLEYINVADFLELPCIE